MIGPDRSLQEHLTRHRQPNNANGNDKGYRQEQPKDLDKPVPHVLLRGMRRLHICPMDGRSQKNKNEHPSERPGEGNQGSLQHRRVPSVAGALSGGAGARSSTLYWRSERSGEPFGGGSSEPASWKYRLCRLWKRGGLKTSPLIVAFARPKNSTAAENSTLPGCPAWQCDTSSPIITNLRRLARPPPSGQIPLIAISGLCKSPHITKSRCLFGGDVATEHCFFPACSRPTTLGWKLACAATGPIAAGSIWSPNGQRERRRKAARSGTLRP